MASNGLNSPGLEADKCNWPRKRRRKSRMQKKGSSRLQNKKQLIITNIIRDEQDWRKLHVIINQCFVVYYDNDKRHPVSSYQQFNNNDERINVQKDKEYLQLLFYEKPVDGSNILNQHSDVVGGSITLEGAQEHLQKLFDYGGNESNLLIDIHWPAGRSLINLQEAKEYLNRLHCYGSGKPIDRNILFIYLHWDVGESINLYESKIFSQKQVSTDQNRPKDSRKLTPHSATGGEHTDKRIRKKHETNSKKTNISSSKSKKKKANSKEYEARKLESTSIGEREDFNYQTFCLKEIFKDEVGSGGRMVITCKHYDSYYDTNKRHPLFSYQLIKDGKPEILMENPPQQIAKTGTKADYKNQGKWSLGHLAPQKDLSRAEAIMHINIVPQDPNHNSGTWRIIETYVHKVLVSHCSVVHVITGAVYEQNVNKKMGDSLIPIPTHLYKVVLCVQDVQDVQDGKKYLGVFVSPNRKNGPVFKEDLSNLEEQIVGIKFFPNLNKDYYDLSEGKFGKFTKYVKKLSKMSPADWLTEDSSETSMPREVIV